jgi:ATP-dependent Lon protease
MLACEFRQRMRDQLNLISPGEYEKIALAVKLEPSGNVIAPSLRDSQREQKVALPDAPAIGEVIGLAVAGDHGCILRFEMQATKGTGRIVPLGSIQKVMRESIETAAQYARAKHEELGITAQWRQSYDVAILGTFMGVPKEDPSAGVALVTGIVSALKGLKVRNDLAMTGEITIPGKVLPVGGIQQKLLAAYEAGIKEVLIPADNAADTNFIPLALKEKLTITPVHRVDQVLEKVLLP